MRLVECKDCSRELDGYSSEETERIELRGGIVREESGLDLELAQNGGEEISPKDSHKNIIERTSKLSGREGHESGWISFMDATRKYLGLN